MGRLDPLMPWIKVQTNVPQNSPATQKKLNKTKHEREWQALERSETSGEINIYGIATLLRKAVWIITNK